VFWAAVIVAVRRGVAMDIREVRLRGSGWVERSDACQRAGVVLLPGPAGREVKRPSASVLCQPARDGEQPASERPGGPNGAVGQTEQLGPAQEVVRECGQDGPGAVGVIVTGGEVSQGLIFEIGDDLLNHRMVSVFGFDDVEVICAVCQEAEVPPVRPQ
jgi:hypothetical protein